MILKQDTIFSYFVVLKSNHTLSIWIKVLLDSQSPVEIELEKQTLQFLIKCQFHKI
jgi:hypothetical protein